MAESVWCFIGHYGNKTKDLTYVTSGQDMKMRMQINAAFVFGMTGFLSACGGGGNDALTEARFLAQSLETAEFTEVTVAELPPSANMRGIVGAELLKPGETVAEQALLGTTEFVADFTTGRLSGSASDFALYEVAGTQDETNPGVKVASLGGRLPVTGSINGVTFDYTATGTLSGPAASGGTAPIATTLVTGTTAATTAGFAKANGLLVGAGEASGTFIPAPGSSLAGGTLQDGVLLVTRR
jgi:hypothetical protein